MALPDLIIRSTARNVRGKPGHAPYILEFTDRYSVYEWGEMPDDIQGKAEGLAFLGWFFFDHLGQPDVWRDASLFPAAADQAELARLRETGLAHHMVGLAGGDLRPLTLDREILSPSRHLLLQPMGYPTAEDDKARQGDLRLLPVKARFEFAKAPGVLPGVTLLGACDTQCVVKTAEDAARESGLTISDMQRMSKLAELVALRLRGTLASIGVELTSGKLHFAVVGTGAGAEFVLADSLGPDTLVLEVDGIRISQDILCDSYRGSHWLTAVEKAKALAAERQERDWKRICTEELKSQPPLLSPIVKEKAAMAYKSLAKALGQRYHGKTVFKAAWDIPQLVQKLKPRAAA